MKQYRTKYFFSALLLIALPLMLPATGAAQSKYDAYFNGVTGSTKVIGFGGAYRAAVDGMTSVVLNPASISMIDGWWDVGFNFGTLSQGFEDIQTGLALDSSETLYLFLGGVFRIREWHDFGIGLMIYNPYEIDLSGRALSNNNVTENISYKFSYVVVSVPMSIRIGNNLTAGINFKATGANMVFAVNDNNGKTIDELEENAIGTAIDAGLLYQAMPNWRVAFTYQQADKLGFEENITDTVAGFTPFREAWIPHRFFVAQSWNLRPDWTLQTDLGLVAAIPDSIVPGSGIANSVQEIQSGTSASVEYHVGVEYQIAPGFWEVRLGHYFQPARIDGAPDRFHVTGGIDYFFWYVKASTALDVAESYLNYSIGLSPSFAHRKRRT